jgi:hypothetical protein
MTVDFGTYMGPEIRVLIPPKINRRIIIDWDKWLSEDHKHTLPGGSAGGGYITPYKRTMIQVYNVLRYQRYKNGVSLSDLVMYCPDIHYANKKQGLYQALTKFETSWVETLKIDGKIHFKLKGECPYKIRLEE